MSHNLKAALMKLAEDWDAEAQVAQSDAERETLLGAAAELSECLAEAAPAPPTPDLKTDLLEMLPYAIRDMRSGNRHNDADHLAALRARLQAATITEPGESPALNFVVPADRPLHLPPGTYRVIDGELVRIVDAPHPPDPCVVECGRVRTQRVSSMGACLLTVVDGPREVHLLRTEAAALIPALQAFVAEGGR